MFAANRLELQTYSMTGPNVPHSSSGPDFSILHKKMEVNGRVNGAYFQCLDKKAAHTYIFYSRRIFNSAASPDDPHTLRRVNSFVVPSRMENLLFQVVLTRACDSTSPVSALTRTVKNVMRCVAENF